MLAVLNQKEKIHLAEFLFNRSTAVEQPSLQVHFQNIPTCSSTVEITIIIWDLRGRKTHTFSDVLYIQDIAIQNTLKTTWNEQVKK